MNGERVFSVAEAAEMLMVSTKTLYRAVESGDLTCLRAGRRVIRFRQSDIDAYTHRDIRKPKHPDPVPVFRL